MIKKFLRDKSNLLIIFCITISSVLLISISILFSSLREYMVNNVKREIGDYHVLIKGDFISSNLILKNDYKDGRNYIKYNEIGRVYKNTKKICLKNKCEVITYNDSLLSLYGISKTKNVLKMFKFYLYFFVCFFGSVIFLILYNAFSISTSIKRKNVVLYKFIGSDDEYIFKLFFNESLFIGILSIILGFIISLFLDFVLIKIINDFLYEIFNGRLYLSIYFSFILIPIVFLFLTIIICSLVPLYRIKKYKAAELFRKNVLVKKCDIRLGKSLIYYLFRINIFRFKDKYRNLIVCIFIFCFSFNVISLLWSYTFKCISDFVIVPEYDLSISVSGEYDFTNIINKFKVSKKNEFRSCSIDVNIPKNYYNIYKKSNIIVTDLGGNEVINNVEIISKKNNKISHLKYQRFKKFDELVVSDYVINDLRLTHKKYLGFDGEDIIINLNRNDFENVCSEFSSNLIIKSDYKGFDKYLNELIKKNKLNMSYSNIKKAKEIINNLILVFKILLYFSISLILLSLFSVAVNTSIFSIYKRKIEFASLKNLGFDFKSIIACLFLESLFVSFLGFILSISFIFVTDKYLYMAISEVFDFGKIIVNYGSLFISFLLSFILVFGSLFVSYLLMCKKEVILGIRGEWFM